MKKKNATTKIMMLFVGIVVAAFFCSCGVRGPEELVDDFCTAMKNLDLENMCACSSCELEFPGVFSEGKNSDELHHYISTNAHEIRFSKGELTRNKTDAWIDVDFTYPDSSGVIEKSLEDLLENAIRTESYTGEYDRKKIAADFDEFFVLNKKSPAELPRVSTTVRLSLSEDKNGWHINYVPAEIYNIMSGNLMSTLDSFEKFYEEDLTQKDKN